MIELTLPVPDALAERLPPPGPWLPTVIELGLMGFHIEHFLIMPKARCAGVQS